MEQHPWRAGWRPVLVVALADVGAPYYLVDNDGDGTLETNSPNDPGVKVPMWVIGTF